MIDLHLLKIIRAQYRLPWDGIHGYAHWVRVLENGLRGAERNFARVEVVKLFAVFHDACRASEGSDPYHGLRGAQLAERLRGTAYDLSDADFKLLYTACEFHTDGRTIGDVTVQTCWDADRLDLGRVGVMPRAECLCTLFAKERATIDWAYDRSVSEWLPGWGAEWEMIGQK
jgi:uncharacterized protein